MNAVGGNYAGSKTTNCLTRLSPAMAATSLRCFTSEKRSRNSKRQFEQHVLHFSCSLWGRFDRTEAREAAGSSHYCSSKATFAYKYWMSSSSDCKLFSPFCSRLFLKWDKSGAFSLGFVIP